MKDIRDWKKQTFEDIYYYLLEEHAKLTSEHDGRLDMKQEVINKYESALDTFEEAMIDMSVLHFYLETE